MTKIDGPMTAWLKDVALKAGPRTLLLLQGYPYSGFAAFTADGAVSIPEHLPPPAEDGWKLYWDLRVFNGETEWHGWRTGDGVWLYRKARLKEWPAENRTDYRRDYYLWGSDEPQDRGAWHLFREDRGAEVWIPKTAGDFTAPPRLHMQLRHDFDPKSGIAGIVDSMVVGLK